MRSQPSLSVKCAAALLAITDEAGKPLIPHEDAKLMTSSQIISLFQFDHWPIRAEAGGPVAPWNLTPRLILAHREKTATIDIPQIAKIRRIKADEEAFRARLLAKVKGKRTQPKGRWPKRTFPTGRGRRR